MITFGGPFAKTKQIMLRRERSRVMVLMDRLLPKPYQEIVRVSSVLPYRLWSIQVVFDVELE